MPTGYGIPQCKVSTFFNIVNFYVRWKAEKPRWEKKRRFLISRSKEKKKTPVKSRCKFGIDAYEEDTSKNDRPHDGHQRTRARHRDGSCLRHDRRDSRDRSTTVRTGAAVPPGHTAVHRPDRGGWVRRSHRSDRRCRGPNGSTRC